MTESNEPAVKLCCPVCGYRGLWRPAYDRLPEPPFPDFGDPPYTDRLGWYSHGACDCCGYEYGFDDAALTKPWSFAAYRRHWLSGGGKWYSSVRPPPAGWDVAEQLRAAGLPAK